jgi:predicted DNA binding CopG/RHH family protein
MRDHYDFAKMKGKKNPYTKFLKQPVTMRLDKDSVDYFKSLAEESGIPYQTLICILEIAQQMKGSWI